MARRRRDRDSAFINSPVLVVRRIPRTVDVLADTRFYHPQAAARPLAYIKKLPRIIAAPVLSARQRRSPNYVSPTIGFASPRNVVLCVKRKTRKEVMIAKKLKNGKGSQRRTEWSDVKC